MGLTHSSTLSLIHDLVRNVLMQQHHPICLASSSPRRKEFLHRYGLDFETKSPDVDERRLPGEALADFIRRVTREKAEAVQPSDPEAVVLAGDTVVLIKNELLGKPTDREHARMMLELLENSWHEVQSAYIVGRPAENDWIEGVESTHVRFLPLPTEVIDWYLATGEGDDKAGAYSIQGLGTALVDRIEGSYNNVVGFPIERILHEMAGKGWISFGAPR